MGRLSRGIPQPVPPIHQPEVVARTIAYAADHPGRKQYYVGASTVATLWTNRLAPAVLDRYLCRTGYVTQQTDSPAPAIGPGNLWRPLDDHPGDDHGTHDAFDARRSPTWTALSSTPTICTWSVGGSRSGRPDTTWRRTPSTGRSGRPRRT